MDSNHTDSWSSGLAPGIFSPAFEFKPLAQCQTAIYEAISFVLDNSVSPKTFRNKIGNWLDWKRGFLVVVLPSEASLMTRKSSCEDTTTGSNGQWVSVDMSPMK